MSDLISMTELELAMRELANHVKRDTIEACAKIAASYPAGFGSEYEASGMIRKGQNDAARDISQRIKELGL